MLLNLVNGRAQDVKRDGDTHRQGLRLGDGNPDTPADRLRHRPALEREDGIEAERCEPQPA